MKRGIHPTYTQATVTCACGNTFTVGSTTSEIHTEVCSACHPFYTGQKKVLDTAGRVERFEKLLEKTKAKRATVARKEKKITRTKKNPPQAKKLG